MVAKFSASQRTELQKLASALGTAIGDLENFLSAVQDEWEDEWDGRSECWQESEAGQEARERIAQLLNLRDKIERIDADIMWIAE